MLKKTASKKSLEPNIVPIPKFDPKEQAFGDHTYSQHAEDFIVSAMFHRLGIMQPSYVDLGAYHPFHISNTAILYERGSRGINVEANPYIVGEFKKYRPEDINLHYGVTGIDGDTLPFYVVIYHPYISTFTPPCETNPFGYNVVEVKTITLDTIIKKYAKGRWPNFLNIDIEGLELPVLRTMTGRPMVICVEISSGGNSYERETRELLGSMGYFMHSWAGENMIFALSDLRDKLT